MPVVGFSGETVSGTNSDPIDDASSCARSSSLYRSTSRSRARSFELEEMSPPATVVDLTGDDSDSLSPPQAPSPRCLTPELSRVIAAGVLSSALAQSEVPPVAGFGTQAASFTSIESTLRAQSYTASPPDLFAPAQSCRRFACTCLCVCECGCTCACACACGCIASHACGAEMAEPLVPPTSPCPSRPRPRRISTVQDALTTSHVSLAADAWTTRVLCNEMLCSAVTDAWLQVITLRVAEQVGGQGVKEGLDSLMHHINVGAEEGRGWSYGFRMLGYQMAPRD